MTPIRWISADLFCIIREIHLIYVIRVSIIGNKLAGDVAEADAVAVALTPAGEGDFVAVLEEFAAFAGREFNRPFAAPG